MWTWIEQIRELLAGLHAGIYPDFGTWTYILLGILVATEGPLSTLLGASAAAAGLLDWRWVLAATVIGNVAGDCIWYFAGYLGKMSWLYEHGRWFGMRPHHVARLEREMRAHARKLIIFAKIAYGLIVPTLVAAGLARVPWRKWFPVVFVVETLWSVLLVWIGYHTTAFIADFQQTIHAAGIAILAAVVVFVVMRFLRKRIDEQELALDPLNQSPASPPLNSASLNGAAKDEAVPAELRMVEPKAEVESKADVAAKNRSMGRSDVHQFRLRESERIR